MIYYQHRWAVMTGASSGLGRGLASRFANRGMSLVLTGRNETRLREAAHQIRRTAPRVKVETVAADLSTRLGVSALLDQGGERRFMVRPTPDGLRTIVISHETQVGLLPRLGRVFLAPRLRAANQAMLDDLARVAGQGAATQATTAKG